jgi:hypothetical protein
MEAFPVSTTQSLSHAGNSGAQPDLYLADFSRVSNFRYQNREMLRKGTEHCVIVHRGALNEQIKDLARQTIAADLPKRIVPNHMTGRGALVGVEVT